MSLKTRYLGIDLPHPIIPGAGPLADDLDTVRRLEDAGAPMITMRSLFEEQIVSEQMNAYYTTHAPAESFPEALSYLPEPDELTFGPDEYLNHLRRVRDAVAVPVVGSINGTTRGGWLGYARLIEDAGADALELNIYDLAIDPDRNSGDVENEIVEIVEHVTKQVSIPVAVKLSQFYTALPNFAKRLDIAGASAIVLFNRFYQPDIDIEELDVTPVVHLSDPSELLLRLRWVAMLHGTIEADLAITGGVHGVTDVVKAIMSGADGVQCVSALLRHGPDHLRVLIDGLGRWIAEHEYESVSQLRGCMSHRSCPDPKALERSNYMRVLASWKE
ncbi:MAG: dihydroorotate dehydrogenase-like protein [Phycisphaera sp.]|nr:dihydroorotate dehydrogenase-like protein [Phycisphaera sp.]